MITAGSVNFLLLVFLVRVMHIFGARHFKKNMHNPSFIFIYIFPSFIPPDKLNLQECENRDSYCFPLTLVSNMHTETSRNQICSRGWEVGHYFCVTIWE